MTPPKSNVYAKPAPNTKTGRALLACGLWLRVSYVGASATIVGLIQIFDGETTPLSPLALALGGAALAVLAWRRAHAALERIDEQASGATTDEPAASGKPSTGNPVGTPAIV